MARPSDRREVTQLEVQLPLDILLHDRPGLFASFVHIEGHNHFERVYNAVVEAVSGPSHQLDEVLLRELTQSILTQSAVHDVNGNANGLYSGRMFIGDAEFVPTIIGNRQSVPDKTFDNTDTVVNTLGQYVIEFAIMGQNPDIAGGFTLCDCKGNSKWECSQILKQSSWAPSDCGRFCCLYQYRAN